MGYKDISESLHRQILGVSADTPPAEAEDDDRLKISVLDHFDNLVDVRGRVPLALVPPAATADPPSPPVHTPTMKI